MNWLQKTVKTIGAALGVRRYVLPTTSTAGAALATAGYGWLRSNPEWEWLPALPQWAAFLIILLFLLLVFMTNYGTKLREELEPEFDLSFSGKGMGVVEAVEHQPIPSRPGHLFVANGRYVRIQIDSRSKGVVSGILPFITRVQFRLPEDGDYIDIQLPQYIALTEKPLEIYPGLPHLVDFVKATDTETDDLLATTAPWPLVLSAALRKKGIYKFTVGVFSPRGGKDISVLVEWRGQWDTLKAHHVT